MLFQLPEKLFVVLTTSSQYMDEFWLDDLTGGYLLEYWREPLHRIPVIWPIKSKFCKLRQKVADNFTEGK